MDYLTEKEKLALKKFINNPVAVEAVKKVLLADIYGVGTIKEGEPIQPRKNWVFGLMMNEAGQNFKVTNDELGQNVRGCIEGIRAVELAFKEMEKLIDVPEDTKEAINEAR